MPKQPLRRLSRILLSLLPLIAARPVLAQAAERAPIQVPNSAAPRPGDIVRLRIWREPDMSGEFPVNESGEAVFPKLGAMRVADMSADSLKRRLVSTYSVYLQDPSIEVTLLRRVSVAGAVRTPGVFTIDPTMTVADVLALAGGPTSDGRPDRVKVFRNGTVEGQSVSRAMRIGDTSVRSGDQLVVPQRSWLSRNVPVVIGAASSAVWLAASLLRR